MSDWLSLGGAVRSNAAAASWGTDEVEIFAVHDDGELRDRYWDGASWHEWESLGGSFVGEPAACARAADRIDVFAIGSDGRLRHRWWDGTQWVQWEMVADAPRGGWVKVRVKFRVRAGEKEVVHWVNLAHVRYAEEVPRGAPWRTKSSLALGMPLVLTTAIT